jgi:hypothetical protein
MMQNGEELYCSRCRLAIKIELPAPCPIFGEIGQMALACQLNETASNNFARCDFAAVTLRAYAVTG